MAMPDLSLPEPAVRSGRAATGGGAEVARSVRARIGGLALNG